MGFGSSPVRHHAKKRREVTYYFPIVLLNFVLPSRSSFKASPALTKAASSWHLDNGSAEAHTCSRVSLPSDFQLPFLMWCVIFGLPQSTASEAESFPYECPVRCRSDPRSGALYPAGHLALLLIREREELFKDLLSFPLSLSCLLYFINWLSVGTSFSFHLPRTVFKRNKVFWYKMTFFPLLFSPKVVRSHALFTFSTVQSKKVNLFSHYHPPQ